MKYFIFVYLIIFSLEAHSISLNDTFKSKIIEIKKYKDYEIEKILEKASKILKVDILFFKLNKDQKLNIKFEDNLISFYDLLYTIESHGGLVQLLLKDKLYFIIYWLDDKEDFIMGKTLKKQSSKGIVISFEKVMQQIIEKDRLENKGIDFVLDLISKEHKIIFTKFPEPDFKYLEKDISLFNLIKAISLNPFLKIFLHFSLEGQIIFQVVSFRPQ